MTDRVVVAKTLVKHNTSRAKDPWGSAVVLKRKEQERKMLETLGGTTKVRSNGKTEGSC